MYSEFYIYIPGFLNQQEEKLALIRKKISSSGINAYIIRHQKSICKIIIKSKEDVNLFKIYFHLEKTNLTWFAEPVYRDDCILNA